ncbi:MAG: hypothetical protein OXH77_00705 [Anaerolineaceae bacterium]|nr:hypothetical protein [Anaerolineaceae bacterium]
MQNVAQFERCKESVRDALIRRACARRTISYSELARRVGLPPQRYVLMRQLPRLVEAINADEVSDGWPLLGALVVRKADGLPGAGFFRHARELGRLAPDASRAAERTFHERELQRIFSAWAE